VHLAAWPKPDVDARDAVLEEGKEAVRRICSLGHAARQKAQVNVRQPLAHLAVWGLDPQALAFVRAHGDVIKDELNVKALEPLATLSRKTRLGTSLDKKEAARRLGPRTPAVAAALEALSAADAAALVASATPRVNTPDGPVDLRPADVRVTVETEDGSVGEFGGGLLVVLATTLTPALVREGLAREVVRRVNDLRKAAGLRVEDRIELRWRAAGEAKEALREFGAWIAGEVLAVRFEEAASPDALTALDLAEHRVAVALAKA
jgi:isoleucyl-tRNA synthetase